jgi:cytosine/adenosine deaminase-related metal-dependent hydrolase
MVHLTRPSGLMSIADEAREIARAAHDVGVSIGLAIAMRDRNPLVYGDHTSLLSSLESQTRELVEEAWLAPLPSVSTQLNWVNEAARAVEDMPGHVDVQYGPTGVQWCTELLLRSIAEESARTGRRVHMHLLETRPQRAWADQTYPFGIVGMLDDIGLLSDRLTLAHCVWANDDELATLGKSGSRIAVNASSNLHLSSGIARVHWMREAGIPVAMGLDGCALDEDDDALRELRLFRLLNGGQGFDVPGITVHDALRCATVTGRAGLGLPSGGVLAPGMPADLLVLDLADIDWDAVMPVPVVQYLFARASKAHIRQAYSRGRLVMEDGMPTGVDLDALHTELRSAYRSGLTAKQSLIARWPEIDRALVDHYRGCC